VQLHAVAFRASEALDAQHRRTSARRETVREAVVPDAITHVVTAVRRMRELADASSR